MPSWVLRFPRQAESSEGPILVHVSQKDDRHVLDLDLLATDGDAAYKTKVRERNLPNYRGGNFDGTFGDWVHILRYGLLPKELNPNPDLDLSTRQNLDIRCVISGKKSKSTLSIVFNIKVEDITHKLGSVDLAYSEDTDDVDLFGWACEIIEQRDDLFEKLKEEQEKCRQLDFEKSSVHKELNDLVERKQQHDIEILSKFALILNEKKAYIRQQQAALADTDAPPIIPNTDSKISRKRKQAPTEADADDESDDFEQMEVDQEEDDANDDDDQLSGQATPARRSSTSSEDQDQFKIPPGNEDKPVTRASAKEEERKTPPPRKLPFGAGKKGKEAGNKQSSVSDAQSKKGQKSEAEDDEETASEDDEL